MTISAIAGPRVDLDGPLPVAPKRSLLSTPGVVVSEGDDGRWLNGVNQIAYPEGVSRVWNACETGTFGVKAEGDAGPINLFDPFVCYLPVTCSAMSYPFIRDWSETVLEATYSFAVEQALVGLETAGLGPNPALGDGSVQILNGGSARSPIVSLSYIENAIGRTGRRGFIHASPAIVAQLNTDTFLDPDQLITTNGNVLVGGDGYIDATANGLRPGTGQDWMFASGPVEVRLSSVFITDLRESLDRSDNTLTFRAERWVLVTWDTSLQVAQLVDWDA